MVKKGAALLLAVFILFGAVACGKADPVTQDEKVQDEKVQDEKVLTWAYHAEPITLDTNVANDNMSGDALYHLAEGLVRNYDGQVVPGIAEKWDVSDDGLTYTFHLRDAKWEDGQPVTAHHFVYSFQRLLSPDTPAAGAEAIFDVVNARALKNGDITDPDELGVRATDDRTLVIMLEQPLSYFVPMLASRSSFYPLRQEFVEEAGDSYGTGHGHFLSNGPFKLAEWKREASLKMVKNENYWNAGEIKLDGLELLIIPDNNAILSMFDNGELDFVLNLPSGHEANYPNHGTRPTQTIAFLEFNLAGNDEASGQVISNHNFRKALSYAIDREAFNRVAVSQLEEPANRFGAPGWTDESGAYAELNPVQNLVSLNGDVARAKEYLAAALDELGMTVGELPTLTFLTMETPTRRTISEALVDTWVQQLGLENIVIQLMPIPVTIENGFAGNFDIYYQTMSSGVDPYNFLEYWHSKHSLNWTRWGDPVYDAMLERVNAIGDPVERFAALRDAEQYLLDHGPLEPLSYSNAAYVQADYVKGVDTSPIGSAAKFIYADLER